MRNLRCGSEKHRFLDIKIGQKTAQVVTGDVGRVGWRRVVPEKWKTDMDGHDGLFGMRTCQADNPGPRQAGWQGKSRVAALRQSMVDGITNSSCEGFRLEVWWLGPSGLKARKSKKHVSPAVCCWGSPMLSKCVRLVWNAVSALLGWFFSCLPCWFFHLVWDAACAFLSLSLILSLSLYSILSFTGKAETKKQKFKLHVRFLQLFGSLVVEWDC